MVASPFLVKTGTVKAVVGFRTVPKLVPGKETPTSRRASVAAGAAWHYQAAPHPYSMEQQEPAGIYLSDIEPEEYSVADWSDPADDRHLQFSNLLSPNYLGYAQCCSMESFELASFDFEDLQGVLDGPSN
ncbi:hypothetical protein N2152v2_007002 [Parachlorella kessleri]